MTAFLTHRSRRILPFLVLILFFVAACGDSGTTTGSGGSTPTATSAHATAVPTKAPTWRVVQTFTGNGNKKTAVFSVPGDWKIDWSCQGQNIGGISADGILAIIVYNSDNTIADAGAVNSTCKASGGSHDVTEEHQSGNVYLDINAANNWTVKIEELK